MLRVALGWEQAGIGIACGMAKWDWVIKARAHLDLGSRMPLDKNSLL